VPGRVPSDKMTEQQPERSNEPSNRETGRDSRKRIRIEVARRRQKIPKQNDPLRGLFWGLLLIMLGILFFAEGRQWLTGAEWWKALCIGLGSILIIDALIHYLNPAARMYAFGRLIPGVVFLFVGIAVLIDFNKWWPLALVGTGVALFFSSWIVQREIEKRKLTQNTLAQSEIKYRHIIDNANSIIIEMDVQGNITFANKFAQEFFGYKEEEILGHNVIGTILPESEIASQQQAGLVGDITINPQNYLHLERENILRNGEKVWIIWTNQPIYDEHNNLKEILCIGINRTEQKKAEDLLARQLKEQTAMEERNRLARDLHDAVSQTLFSASLIAEVLPKLWDRNPEEGKKRILEIRELTRGALAEMRTLLLELRPVALKDAELSDLLRQLSESINGRARIPVALEIEGQNPLPMEVKVALYRIAQEALNNVAKHSAASQATVKLSYLPDRVLMEISDNGKGFETKDIQTRSLGLGIMRERAKEINAQLSVESLAGEGTKIAVTREMGGW